MAALSAARTAPKRAGNQSELPVKGSTKIYQGGMVGIKAALALVAAADIAMIIVGVAERTADNSAGADGDINVKIDRGVFRFDIYGSDAVAIGDVGATVYVYDDHTIAKTDGGATRPVAGKLMDVDSVGAWVRIGGDVASRKTYVPLTVQTLVGTGVYNAVAPLAGKVTKMWSVIDGVLTTGDATLTGKINGSAITGGVVTIPQAGSAIGNVASAAPSAANTVAAGDALSVTVGGSNATASKANVLFEITT